MKILNYGSLNIDLVFSVPHIVLPGETIASTHFDKSAGGKGANQSAALAKAQAPIFHAGKIGADGQFLIDLLKSYGVNTSFITKYPGSTGQAVIQLDNAKQNAIILHAGGNAQITCEEIDAVLSHFSSGDMLVLQNEIVHTDYLIREAHKRNMLICLNPAPFDKSVFTLPLDLVNIIVVNEIEGAGLTHMSLNTPVDIILNALIAAYPHAEVILTAGKQGAFYGFKDERYTGSIVDVPVVDTTGAGDTFIGYFLAAKLNGFSIPHCLRLACKASSIAVSRLGAMEAIPFADEVFEKT